MIVAAFDLELDESAGQLFALPGRGRLARQQPNHCVPYPDRLARLHRQVADNTVALVEKADDRDPLGHRCHPRLGSGAGALLLLLRLVLLLPGLVTAAAGRADRQRQHEDEGTGHVYSGIQGS